MEIYETSAFKKWFEKIKDDKTKEIIDRRIYRIAAFADFRDYKILSKNLLEIRFDYGPGYRIYMARKESMVIILLLGGNKSTQERDMRRAEKLAQTPISEEKTK